MKILYAKDADTLSRYAADRFVEQIKSNPKSILGLATGSTPKKMYEYLGEDTHAGKISFSEATSFNLDEYVGLAADHPASYHYFMEEYFFSKVDFKEGANSLPNGVAENLEKEALDYDQRIQDVGELDILILGIGSNAHIGFNEPDDVFEPLTHVVALDHSTRQDNARFFDSIDEVPTHAISLGMRAIMRAKKVLLLAFGENKAEAIRDLVKGKVDPKVPASILQLHANATILIDEGAASLLDESDYSSI
jgi:glucosamine-6-phosphate deaminase